MADRSKTGKVTLEELVVSTLATTDALAKLLIAKGIITDEEFKTQLTTERANYLAVLKRLQVLLQPLMGLPMPIRFHDSCLSHSDQGRKLLQTVWLR